MPRQKKPRLTSQPCPRRPSSNILDKRLSAVETFLEEVSGLFDKPFCVDSSETSKSDMSAQGPPSRTRGDFSKRPRNSPMQQPQQQPAVASANLNADPRSFNQMPAPQFQAQYCPAPQPSQTAHNWSPSPAIANGSHTAIGMVGQRGNYPAASSVQFQTAQNGAVTADARWDQTAASSQNSPHPIAQIDGQTVRLQCDKS